MCTSMVFLSPAGRMFLALALCGLFPRPLPAAAELTTYFANTQFELNVYRIQGRRAGNAMLLIGGIHNEPGGYEAADKYVNLTLEQGTLIVVPRANFNTILHGHRGIHGDMNRKFADAPDAQDDDLQIVAIIKALIAESDVVLNLHDGSGFFRPVYVDARHNPARFGQCIIADSDVYYSRRLQQTLDLGGLAERICRSVNARIAEPEYHFHFNNHQTLDDDSPHPEQRGSATYYALFNLEIPAFGIETSKDLPTLAMKVEHQVLIINAFLREFDIIPSAPGNALETPVLKFLNIAVNGGLPTAVERGGVLEITPGDEVTVTHIEANYERGLSVDVQGLGGLQDLRVPLRVWTPTSIIVRKDHVVCGRVQVRVRPAATAAATAPEERGDFLDLEVNQVRRRVALGDRLRVVRGDVIRILGASPALTRRAGLRVNFYGYPAPDRSAEDRGYAIHTDTDLLSRYAVDPAGRTYEIRAQVGARVVGAVMVELVDPELRYVLVRWNGNNRWWGRDGETLEVARRDRLEIVDVATNLPADRQARVQVNFRGFAGAQGAEDRGQSIRLAQDLLPRFSVDGQGTTYAIEVSYAGRVIGTVFVHLQDAVDPAISALGGGK